MARKAKRGARPARGSGPELAYPIGTRLAEGYGMDLDREAKRGLSGDFRRPLPGPEIKRTSFLLPVILAVLAGIILFVERGRPARIVTVAPPADLAFADQHAAVMARAFTDQILPPFTPDSATDIHVRGTWLAFRTTPEQLKALQDRFDRVPDEQLAKIPLGGLEVAWWPAGLRHRKSLTNLEDHWIFFFTGRSLERRPGQFSAELMAVDRSNTRAYFWRGGD